MSSILSALKSSIFTLHSQQSKACKSLAIPALQASWRHLCDSTSTKDIDADAKAGTEAEAEADAHVNSENSAEAERAVDGGDGVTPVKENTVVGEIGEEPQIAYYEAWHRKGRYPSRAEIGNYSDPGTLDTEMLLDWEARDDGPKGTRLYDLPKWLRHNMPEHAPRPRIEGLLAEALKDEDIKELHDYFSQQEDAFRASNSPSIFRWEVQFVLSVGGENHPANRKVKLRVYMKELQEMYGLNDEAVQHICRICQKRYNPASGVLTLSVEKYPHREDNRRECMRIIEQLVIEGMRKSPGISDEECSDAFFEKGEGSADVELAAG